LETDDVQGAISMDAQPATAPAAEEASREYLGQWNRLVSTTNWEKGRIIAQWRQALAAAGASPLECSDEAWSRRAGHVSGQHVGRLRRVYERFGGVFADYQGLYWSHFQAALDWTDAEMWLEGAVQNSWSISQMRFARWEVLGKPASERPQDEDVVAAELDEDAPPADAADGENLKAASQTIREAPVGPDFAQGPDFGDEDGTPTGDAAVPFDGDPSAYAGDGEAAALVRPFADLPPLPADVQDAFDQFKLAILRHKLADWSEIARDHVLATLDALKQLALAPSDAA
jgi:hypothetical protein